MAIDHAPQLTLVNVYLDHLRSERGLAENTVDAYRRDLAVYANYLDEVGVADPVTADEARLVEFVAWLRQRPSRSGRPYATASLARIVVAVRGFHRFLAAEGLASSDPAAQLETPTASRPLPTSLSVELVEQLLAAPVGEGPAVRRDRAILELLYGAGLRITELVDLDIDDVDPVERLLRVRGKGSRERLVPFGDLAATELDGWLVQGRPAWSPTVPAVFLNARGGRLTRQGAWKRIKHHAAAVGLSEQVSPHTLRHAFATHLIDNGADVRAVQELLGHASVTTTQIYTLVSRAALRSVYEQAHPRARR